MTHSHSGFIALTIIIEIHQPYSLTIIIEILSSFHHSSEPRDKNSQPPRTDRLSDWTYFLCPTKASPKFLIPSLVLFISVSLSAVDSELNPLPN